MSFRYLYPVALVVLGVVARKLYNRRKALPLPPGPPGDPILGHLRLLAGGTEEEIFHELSQEYGDVIYLNVLGRPLVVLDTVEDATELMEKRGAIYSSRPELPLFNWMGWTRTLSFLPYGKLFMKHRKAVQKSFTRQESRNYESIQLHQAHVLVDQLLTNPADREKAIQWFSTAVITKLLLGHDITSKDDELLYLADQLIYAVNNAGPIGSTPPDFFPWLRYLPSWFPGSYYAHFVKDRRASIRKIHDYSYDLVAKQLADGQANASLLADEIRSLDDDCKQHSYSPSELEDLVEDVNGYVGVIFGAGIDTTWSSLSFFFFALMLNPKLQLRAQAEIDRVTGGSRLPDFGDIDSLPYITCLVQETLRWYPVTPLGVPHATTEDDYYKGYFIPKGCTVIANNRGSSLDTRVYQNPREFNPDRFLPKPEGNGEPPYVAAFGYGRRVCPGRFLAEANLWIAIASIIAVFTLSRPLDDKGEEILPKMEYFRGLVHHPKPFQVVLKPRSSSAVSLVKSAVENE